MDRVHIATGALQGHYPALLQTIMDALGPGAEELVPFVSESFVLLLISLMNDHELRAVLDAAGSRPAPLPPIVTAFLNVIEDLEQALQGHAGVGRRPFLRSRIAPIAPTPRLLIVGSEQVLPWPSSPVLAIELRVSKQSVTLLLVRQADEWHIAPIIQTEARTSSAQAMTLGCLPIAPRARFPGASYTVLDLVADLLLHPLHP